ncbi:MAG: hypothetical protein K9W46_13200 [Candidatus Heimdallarchaeum endolithica]|uniref:DUF4064 domain-containing protein n=1 Tax=Candidatus Heimdallarchaeum endolithica TaxID=2876572 RepID=A0A9Y1FNN1_9ARCH|nr:MAG: hypothetical protein K9W46_13200 [Candidatus Heimdallarchaeum endolithica]
MARKTKLEKWGKTLSIIGGVLYILGGVFLILHILLQFNIGTLELDLIAKGFLLKLIGYDFIIAVITIVLGILAIALPSSKLSDLLLGIVLIVLGIIGIGLPGLIVVIAGIVYIVASTKKR